jgi:hypothetical protein
MILDKKNLALLHYYDERVRPFSVHFSRFRGVDDEVSIARQFPRSQKLWFLSRAGQKNSFVVSDS